MINSYSRPRSRISICGFDWLADVRPDRTRAVQAVCAQLCKHAKVVRTTRKFAEKAHSECPPRTLTFDYFSPALVIWLTVGEELPTIHSR